MSKSSRPLSGPDRAAGDRKRDHHRQKMQRGVDAHVGEAAVPVEPLIDHVHRQAAGSGFGRDRTIAPPSPLTAVAMRSARPASRACRCRPAARRRARRRSSGRGRCRPLRYAPHTAGRGFAVGVPEVELFGHASVRLARLSLVPDRDHPAARCPARPPMASGRRLPAGPRGFAARCRAARRGSRSLPRRSVRRCGG
jgi:hypothetical protein